MLLADRGFQSADGIAAAVAGPEEVEELSSALISKGAGGQGDPWFASFVPPQTEAHELQAGEESVLRLKHDLGLGDQMPRAIFPAIEIDTHVSFSTYG
jgi:hypothetical protein